MACVDGLQPAVALLDEANLVHMATPLLKVSLTQVTVTQSCKIPHSSSSVDLLSTELQQLGYKTNEKLSLSRASVCLHLSY